MYFMYKYKRRRFLCCVCFANGITYRLCDCGNLVVVGLKLVEINRFEKCTIVLLLLLN